MPDKKKDEVTIESLPKLLENDTKVKLAGVDVDGQLRGKLISKKKFLGIAEEGFGFCSVVFGWDMHDRTYFRELKISNAENGYHDLIAIPDLRSFRRIPWEDDVPFFLVSFFDPDTEEPVSVCPRGVLKNTVEKLHKKGLGAMAGGRSLQLRELDTANITVFCLQLSTNSSNLKHLQAIRMRQHLNEITRPLRPFCEKIL